MAVRKLNPQKPEIAAIVAVIGAVLGIIATIIGATWYLSSELNERPTLDQMEEKVSSTLDAKLQDFQIHQIDKLQIDQLKASNLIDQKVMKIQIKINEMVKKMNISPLEIAAIEDSLNIVRNNIAQLLKIESPTDTFTNLLRKLIAGYKIEKFLNQTIRFAS